MAERAIQGSSEQSEVEPTGTEQSRVSAERNGVEQGEGRVIARG